MLPKSDTLSMMYKELIIVGIYATGLCYIEIELLHENPIFLDTIRVHSLVGFVIGLLLVFRTNSAYDRWWEGRKHWGALVNNTRNLTLKLNSVIKKDNIELRDYFKKMVPNYAFAMKEHLRNGVIVDELENVDDIKQKIKELDHVPNYIAKQLYEKIHQLYSENKISGEELYLLDKELKALTDIVGACERIKKTPIPFSYLLFIKKFIFIYVATIPLGFIPIFKYWTIPIALFIFYVFVSLELLAEEIEDPFGKDDNDLPTDELCVTIKKNINEIMTP